MTMERYWDKSEKDRAAMAAEQVSSMLAVELMEAGVPNVESPLMRDIPEITIDTTKFYEVFHNNEYGTSESSKYVFATMEQAQAFIEAAPLKSDYDYRVGNDYPYAMPLTALKIQPVELSDKAAVTNLQSKLEKRQGDKEANEKANRVYTEAVKKVTDATSGVWEDWHACQGKELAAKEVEQTLAEYTTLCNGDETLAKTFLAKAFDAERITEAAKWLDVDWTVAIEEAD